MEVNQQSFYHFLKVLAPLEKQFILGQYTSSHNFFPDPIFLKNLSQSGDNLDMTQLKIDYYQSKLGTDPKTAAIEYMKGMLFIINYYTYGMPDWQWWYRFHYSPFLSDLLLLNENDLACMVFKWQPPLPILLHLCLVLPPSDMHLLPRCFHGSFNLFSSSHVQMDITGKKRESDGIVLLPLALDLPVLKSNFMRLQKELTVSEQKRNKPGRIFLYKIRTFCRPFYSLYGNIMKCPVEVVFVE
jgi:5'-3' exonuclease